ncbi:hypothetical protein BKA61DRAFT_690561 [Leptodontidium sp. MPI-SDFR-AT-0119]|nr:hypothetical protein BKA61DRAFT_690561 [Leptodontidium sp. MPI-SDFR-AT-0119]
MCLMQLLIARDCKSRLQHMTLLPFKSRAFVFCLPFILSLALSSLSRTPRVTFCEIINKLSHDTKARGALQQREGKVHPPICSSVQSRRAPTPQGVLTIFRTVYTKESDENWDLVLATITTHVALVAGADRKDDESLDPGPNQITITKFKNRIFGDKDTLNGAGIESIRRTFIGWEPDLFRRSAFSDLVLRNACIVIDEEALNSLLHGCPDPLTIQGPAQSSSNESSFLKLTDK